MPTATSRHFDLGEMLARPRIRVLRSLRFFGWCNFSDLAIALDDRECVKAGLREGLKRGHVESHGEHRDHQYRITASGREALKQMATDYDQRLGEAAA